MQVLSLSTVFPRPGDEQFGLFVRSRLQALARLAAVKVVAPVPLFEYRARQERGAAPRWRQDGALEVFYPRWFYPPRSGVATAGFLALRLLPYLRRLRESYRFDVLDAHFGHPEGVAAAILAGALGTPFTITLRGVETQHAQAHGRRRGMQWAFARAARIVTVSERLRQFAIEMGAEAARVTTIPNGIDASVFYARPQAESRARLGIPAGGAAILSAGHLIELKGHHRVVRALRHVREQGIDAELWIVGGAGRAAAFEEALRREVRESGLGDAVHFTGAVTQSVLAEYMSAVDVFCLASAREGWPNVVNEALACGTPVVATDVGAVPEMLPSADYGSRTAPEDQEALASALEGALRRQWDRERIAEWGAARSWERVGAETARVLEEAATAGGPALRNRTRAGGGPQVAP